MSSPAFILAIAGLCAGSAAPLVQPETPPAIKEPEGSVRPKSAEPEPTKPETPKVQQNQEAPTLQVGESTRVPPKVRFDARLTQLTPTRPEEYFLLGEEVADDAATVEDRRLATELFVLAIDLDMKRPGRSVIASSACVALADLVRLDRDRRWLQFMAKTLDPRRVPPEWLVRQSPATVESAVYQVATAVGLVRSGDGVQARQLLDKPEVRTALQSYDRMLANLGAGSAARIVRESERWPCRECQNQRIVRKQANPPEYRLCPACKGDPGPDMTEAEFVGQLRFEMLLLQGNQRSWAAQIASDGGAPLRDTDPATLAGYFDVDPSLVLWRDGRWVRDPNAPVPSRPAGPSDPVPPVEVGPAPPPGTSSY